MKVFQGCNKIKIPAIETLWAELSVSSLEFEIEILIWDRGCWIESSSFSHVSQYERPVKARFQIATGVLKFYEHSERSLGGSTWFRC